MKNKTGIVLLLAGLGFCALAEEADPIDTKTYELKYANPAEIAGTINRMWRDERVGVWKVAEPAVAFGGAHAVAVTAPRSVLANCDAIIAKIDRKPKQVYIEARFIELQSITTHAMGFDWSMMTGVGVAAAGEASFGAANFAPGTIYAAKYGSSGSYSATEIAGTGREAKNSFYQGTLSTTQLKLLLAAFDQSGVSKVFANPKVIVASGREALVDMTTKRPNVVVSAKRIVGDKNNTLDIESKLMPIPGRDRLMFAEESFFSWGIQLGVCPNVTEDGMINLKVIPSVSTLSDTTVQTEGAYVAILPSVSDSSVDSIPESKFPIIDVKRIETEFMLHSGETAVIGGLTKTEEEEVDTGIPYLRDIPWIGHWLFGNRNREKMQREILVLVTVTMADEVKDKVVGGLPSDAVLTRQYFTGDRKLPSEQTPQEIRSVDKSSVDDRK